MKSYLWLAAVAVAWAGCAGPHEITESGGAKIPAFYAAHQTGIVENPTDADVALAVKFGFHAKQHSDVVQSAYISRNEFTAVSPETFHIVVRTPLYLISRNAMEQDTEGHSPDPQFIAFARQLGCVQLSLSKANISSDTWRDYVLDRDLVLLRDGVRVVPLAAVPAWKGLNPFDDPDDPLDSWQSTTWLKRGVEEMEQDKLRGTEEATAGRKDKTRARRLHAGWVELEPGDAVFSVAQLRQPGHYEIVFRAPPGTPLAQAPLREARLPIVFDGFR